MVKYWIYTDISISVHRVNKWWGNRSGSINLSVLPCVPCHKRSVFALHGWFALWALCKNWGGQLENWSSPKLGLQVRVNMVMSDFTEDVRSVQCNVDCRRFKFVSSVRHLAPGPLSIGAYFEKRWSGYQETFGSISMTEIVSGARFSCLRSTFLV